MAFDRDLRIRMSRVRKAAETCPDSKRVLEELFPEAFPPKELPIDGWSRRESGRLVEELRLFLSVPDASVKDARAEHFLARFLCNVCPVRVINKSAQRNETLRSFYKRVLGFDDPFVKF